MADTKMATPPGSYLRRLPLRLVATGIDIVVPLLVAELGLPFLVARAETSGYVGNSEAQAPEKRLIESGAAVTTFFRDLPDFAGLSPNRILFVFDGLRYPPPNEAKAKASYFGIMRRHFIAEAVERSYEAIDEDSYFFDHFGRHGQAFEWPTDTNWNSLAHSIMAEAVSESQT